MDNRVQKHKYATMSPRAAKEKEDRFRRARAASPAQRLYRTPAWKVLRAQVLRDQPMCSAEGCRRRSSVVDHKVPHKGDTNLFFDRTNLQGMCKPCHDRKTVKHDGGFGKPTSQAPDRAPPTLRDDDEPEYVIA